MLGADVLRAVDEDALVIGDVRGGLALELRVLGGGVGDQLLGLVDELLRLLGLPDGLAGDQLSPPARRSRSRPCPWAARRSARASRAGRTPSGSARSRSPMIRSGRCAATFSICVPSVLVSTTGFGASPSSSVAHGKIAPGCLPNHSVVATGTTPSASSASCSRRPTTTTRLGCFSIVVEPYLCSIVTGKAPGSACGGRGGGGGRGGSSSEPQAASRAAHSSAARTDQQTHELGHPNNAAC